MTDRHRMLLPLALVQGLWVLRRTPRLPAPVGTYGRMGLGLGSPLRVVGLGDSIMAGTGVSEQRDSLTAVFARLLLDKLARDVEWRVHGYNGATSASVLHKLAPAVPPAHVYLLSCGVNDATRGVPPVRFAAHLAGIVALLRRKAPHSAILFAGLPPLESFPALPWPLRSILAGRVDELQAAAADLFAGYDHAHCFWFPSSMPADEFASDGFHPAATACERWARGLLELWPPVVPEERREVETHPARPARPPTKVRESVPIGARMLLRRRPVRRPPDRHPAAPPPS